MLSIVDYSRVRVFREATVLPIITTVERSKSKGQSIDIFAPVDDGIALSRRVSQAIWQQDENFVFNIDISELDVELRTKIEKSGVPLESMAQVKFGIKLYETGKGLPPQRASDAENHVFEASKRVNKNYRRYLEGKDVNRYAVSWQYRWLFYGRNLAAPRDPNLFMGERLLIRRIVGERMIATYTNEDYVTSQLLQIVKPTDSCIAKYLLGIIDSSLLAYYFRKKYNRTDKTFPEIRIYELAAFPIRTIDFANKSDKAKHDRMVELVERMLDLHKKLAGAKSPADKERLPREIAATDRQIDQLVYELYGLSADEIAIVEGAAKNTERE